MAGVSETRAGLAAKRGGWLYLTQVGNDVYAIAESES